MSTYIATYIALLTISDIWVRQFHQNVEISGLHYIACSLGEVISSLCSGYIMDILYKRRKNKTKTAQRDDCPLMDPGFMIG